MSTSSRVIKNTGFLYLRMGITIVVSLWTTRIILNALGTDDFGIYNVVGGAISLLAFVNAALASATQRFLNIAEGHNDLNELRTIFNCAVGLHALAGIVFGLLLAVSGIVFFNGVLDIPIDRINSAKIVYACMAISTVFTVISAPYEAAINAHENMKWYAVIGILEVVFKLGIAYALYISQSDRLILYGILMACVPIVNLSILRIYCHKKYDECYISIKNYFSISVSRDIAGFAGWNALNTFSGMTTQYGLNIVINHFFGVVLNAAQGIANQISGVLFALSQNALKALNPIIFKSGDGSNNHRLQYVSFLGCRVTFVIFAFFSFPVLAYMEPIISMWLKNVPAWAPLFCQLQLIRLMTELLTLSLNSSIMATGRVRNYNVVKSIINLSPLVIIPILFYIGFKPYWMYIVWIVMWSGAGGIVTVYYASKLMGISSKKYLREVIYPATLLSVVSMSLIFISALMTNKPIAILFAVLYIASFILIGWFICLKDNERKSIINIIRPVLSKLSNKF